jgi:serine/threonine protein kinase
MATDTLQPGFRLGKYEVVAHIGTGGMGAVYRATDTELGRSVALKVLAPRLNYSAPEMERFRREARHAARLNHPNIVTLFECGYDADHDRHYLALEFVEGIDLEKYINRKGQLAPEEARRVLMQAAKALDHAFERGVIHRDIKPSNFMLDAGGGKAAVKLTDLGLALVEDEDAYKVTREGTTVGTVDYLSPEQARDSRAADVRSDIYSLGCTAYHMLAGQPPFAEGGLGERVFKHQTAPPVDIRRHNPAVSAAFWAVLQKMLAKKPEDRYQTPAELLADLRGLPAEADDEVDAPTVPVEAGRRKTEEIPAAPPPTSSGSHPTSPTQPATSPESGGAVSLVTAEQARAAAAFYDRAVQVLAEGGGDDYARELLANCLKLDPFNQAYHKTLREVNRKAARGVLGRLWGSLNVLALKSGVRLARTGRDWRKVLERGEDVLARQPADLETHLAMAEAAEAVDQPLLAAWLLEQAHDLLPDNLDLMRALARQHEKVKNWKRAISLWERVSKRDPSDHEARRKIMGLAAEDHISRGNVRR